MYCRANDALGEWRGAYPFEKLFLGYKCFQNPLAMQCPPPPPFFPPIMSKTSIPALCDSSDTRTFICFACLTLSRPSLLHALFSVSYFGTLNALSIFLVLGIGKLLFLSSPGIRTSTSSSFSQRARGILQYSICLAGDSRACSNLLSAGSVRVLNLRRKA